MRTPAWVPAVTRIGLIVWALMGAVYSVLLLSEGSPGGSFFFTVDTISFRVWVAGLGLLGLAAIVAGARASSRGADLPPWVVGAFAVGVISWLFGSIILTGAGNEFSTSAPTLGRFLDTIGLRVAAGAFGYGALLWFGAPGAGDDATGGSS